MSEDAERDADSGDQEATEANKKSRPWARKRGLAVEGLLQPVKISKATLYKPPTSEELSRLKETENLFHSNLLRLQVEELLKEVTLKESRKQKIDSFLHQINALLAGIPETPEAEIMDQSWLPKDVKVPLVQVPFCVKGRFRFLPPVSVKVMGSYLLGTCIKPAVNVDVALTMPRGDLPRQGQSSTSATTGSLCPHFGPHATNWLQGTGPGECDVCLCQWEPSEACGTAASPR
uniref:Uncharacterized protein n=1 Tax=Sphaerodactylus townsendi TaxID=933632 RepID=A0ACB8ENV2_9SAUR